MSEKQQEYMVRLRQALLSAISEDDMREIGKGLVAEAKRGDPQALRTILQLLAAPPAQVRQIGPIHVQSNGKRAPKVVHQIGNGEGE